MVISGFVTHGNLCRATEQKNRAGDGGWPRHKHQLWLGLPTVEKWVIGDCLAKRIHPGIVIFGEVTHEKVTAITCHFNSTSPEEE